MNFAENLMALRRSRNWSQEELGEKLGVTRQTVSKWELGQTTPELEKLVELARLFDIRLDELVGTAEASDSALGRQRGARLFCPAEDAARPGGCCACSRCAPVYEYISPRKILGLPLVHVRIARRGLARATGIIAIGNAAVGLVSIGGCALGIISLGGVSVGLLLALGGASVGLFSLGGMAVGGFALGGLAVSQWFSLGGGAVSGGLAIGGGAVGHVAVGDSAVGTYAFAKDAGVSLQEVWAVIRREFPHMWEGIRGILAAAFR